MKKCERYAELLEMVRKIMIFLKKFSVYAPQNCSLSVFKPKFGTKQVKYDQNLAEAGRFENLSPTFVIMSRFKIFINFVNVLKKQKKGRF